MFVFPLYFFFQFRKFDYSEFIQHFSNFYFEFLSKQLKKTSNIRFGFSFFEMEEDENQQNRRYRSSKFNRAAYAVNNICKFCFQVGKDPLNGEDKSEADLQIKETDELPKEHSQQVISDPIILPILENTSNQ
jgi:hypothetical protein